MNDAVSNPLTIFEEFLLLAINERVGRFYATAKDTFDCAFIGAIFMDLTVRQRVDNDLRSMFVLDDTPTGDDILDPILTVLSLAPVMSPRLISEWLRQFVKDGEAYRERALLRLEKRGILTRKDNILLSNESRTFTVVNNHNYPATKLRILDVIIGNEIPHPHDVMLISLAHACSLFQHMLSTQELTLYGLRIIEISAMDLIGQAVSKTVNEFKSAVAMADKLR